MGMVSVGAAIHSSLTHVSRNALATTLIDGYGGRNRRPAGIEEVRMKALFAIKHRLAGRKSLKAHAWYIWY